MVSPHEIDKWTLPFTMTLMISPSRTSGGIARIYPLCLNGGAKLRTDPMNSNLTSDSFSPLLLTQELYSTIAQAPPDTL